MSSFRSQGGLSRMEYALPIPLLCRAHADTLVIAVAQMNFSRWSPWESGP